MVEITHTNMAHDDSIAILSIYQDELETLGPNAEAIAVRLMREFGGFWNAYFLGEAFSYSVYCIAYVELASRHLNVLLCKEAVDAEGEDCGGGLTAYSNGTLTGPRLAGGSARLDHYANYQVDAGDALERAKSSHVPVVLAMVDALELYAPRSAVALRSQLESRWPYAKWNVLVERNPGGHYYYSEEQFNLLTPQLTLAVFDRRCYTLAHAQLGPWTST